jgi:Fungal specific transcription factor domain
VAQDDLSLDWGSPLSWVEVVSEMTGNEPCLKNAFSALILSQVSRDSKDRRLVQASTRLYLGSLQELQVALRDHERMYSDEVLIASLLLGLYEVFEGCLIDANDSWLSHAQGAAQLIELRGPKRHQSRHVHQAFLASRVTTISAGIVQRRATYLAAKNWRTLPWETQHRTYVDHLVDIATDLPGLLERIDSLKQDDPRSSGHDRRLLFEELSKTQEAVDIWKRFVKREAAAQAIKHTVTEDDDLYPFSTKLWFDNHIFANATALYHTYSLVIAESVKDLLDGMGADEFDERTYRPVFDAEHHATSIAKLIPYCLQPDMGGLGACIINFPANLALRYFESRREHHIALWLAGILKQHQQRKLSCERLACTPRQETLEKTRSSATAKSESSDEMSQISRRSTPTDRRLSRVLVKFVYEDPSRHYIDTTEDLPHIRELAIRSRIRLDKFIHQITDLENDQT